MKKLLSILLTLCLLIAVTVVPVPAMAATGQIMFDYGDYGVSGSPVSHTVGEAIDYPELPANSNGSLVWSLYDDVYEEPPVVLEDEYLQVYAVLLEGLFNFENYSPNRYIAMSGRIAVATDPADANNTVIKFDNNGIPYRSSDVDKSNSYTKSGSTYTKAASTDIDAALAADPNAYSNYYHASAQLVGFKSTTTTYGTMEAYNAIELGDLEASKTYRLTINYKRESLVNDLYVQPVSWDQNANWRNTMCPYNDARITIPATDTADSDYVTVSTLITTPEDLVDAEKNEAVKGNFLRLILFTGVADANNVVYFDDITVEEVVTADLTCHYADGTQKVVDAEVGKPLPTPDPNKLGENGGVWYLDAQGTTLAPATMVEGLEVYEVVKTGVFDFDNYYRYHDYTGNSYGINTAAVVDSIYADGNGNLVVDSTKYGKATNQGLVNLRNYVIAIGEAKASTDYKITVEYSYTAENADQRLVLTPLTGYGTLTYNYINGAGAAQKYGTSVELPQGTNQSIDLFYTTVDEFYVNGDKSESDYKNGETGEVANSFYLNVKTTEDGQTAGDNAVLATITKITVVEYVEPAQTCTVTFNRGGVEQKLENVTEGTEITLPDTEFTDTSWWNNEAASSKAHFVGYEGEKVVVNGDVTFYTAETYSYGQAKDSGYKAGQSVYRNWTGIDTTTEAFSYLYKTVTSDASSSWVYGSSSRVCTRLGVVEDGKTYRISVTYKATTDADITFHMLTTSLTNSGGTTRNYLENGKAFHTVSGNTNGWTTATFYITVDLPAEVTESTDGLDDTKAFTGEGLYLTLGKATGNDNVEIAIKETKVEKLGDVVGATGASVLTDAVAQANGKQAIRYYFNYATANDGTTITIGGTEYTVKERGFIYTNGAISNYAKYNEQEGREGYYSYEIGNTTYGFAASHFMMWLAKAKAASGKGLLTAKGVSGDALLKNWSLENNTLTFSTYITNIPESAYDVKFMVRGYVTFEDENGVQHTIYSKTVNRSVNGIANVLNERH